MIIGQLPRSTTTMTALLGDPPLRMIAHRHGLQLPFIQSTLLLQSGHQHGQARGWEPTDKSDLARQAPVGAHFTKATPAIFGSARHRQGFFVLPRVMLWLLPRDGQLRLQGTHGNSSQALEYQQGTLPAFATTWTFSATTANPLSIAWFARTVRVPPQWQTKSAHCQSGARACSTSRAFNRSRQRLAPLKFAQTS